MLPAAAVSVKSAARWGIFVRRPGVRMACVEGGRGGLYIASGDHEGRHSGTQVKQRRGQVQNQRGGAFIRFAPFGGRSHGMRAAAKVARDTDEPAQGQVRNQRRGSGFAFVCTVQARSHEDAFGRRAETGQGRAAHWIMAAAACIIGAALVAVQIPRECRQSTAGTGGVSRTNRSGLCSGVRDIQIGRESSGSADGKAARVGGKSSGRLPTRSHGARAGAEVAHHVGAGVGMKLAAQRAKAVRLAPSRSHCAEVRRGRFHRADAVVKATGASFGSITWCLHLLVHIRIGGPPFPNPSLPQQATTSTIVVHTQLFRDTYRFPNQLAPPTPGINCTHASLSHVKNTTIGGLNSTVFPGLNNGIMDSTQPAIDTTDRAAFQPPPDGAEKHESRRSAATLSPPCDANAPAAQCGRRRCFHGRPLPTRRLSHDASTAAQRPRQCEHPYATPRAMPLYPPRSAGGMWQPPAVFTAATWR
ncbi:hypothetical protein B0H13DRAFT_2655759 [Mycena leptocephala]|nr:hypothetical protein B0H13DRAFT_2655759 [Mycena leptocephala]